jgi:hypothetical protein
MSLPKNIRPSVVRMARNMEAQLLRNDKRGGWESCSDDFLVERIRSNVFDLFACAKSGEARQRTCADIANYAMMLSENSFLREGCVSYSVIPIG